MLQELSNQLKRDEAIRLKPYRCPAGKLTIGVGRNLDDVGITLPEAEYLLANDIERMRLDLLRRLPWLPALDEARQGALLNMAFNLGVGGLLEFRETLACVETHAFDQAAAKMLQSRWAAQVGARAHRLSEQMRTGLWQ